MIMVDSIELLEAVAHLIEKDGKTEDGSGV
jgi:hypothetical protein